MTEASLTARRTLEPVACGGRAPSIARRRCAAGVIAGSIALLATAPAHASAAADALNDARARLHATPPDPEGARAALERAVAAADDPAAVAEAHFHLGGLDEDDGAFARALEHDRAAVDAAPSSRWARSARGRLAWVGERSEGGFAPLVRLMHVWRDPRFGSDPAAVDAFSEEVETFPPGIVRGEARMFLADLWLRRVPRPAKAERELLRVRDDPSASAQSRTFAERELAEELLAEGRLDDASAEVAARESRLEPAFVARVRRLLRRRSLSRVAWGAVAVSLVLSAGLAWRSAIEGRVARVARGIAGALGVVVGLAAAAFLVCDALRPALLEHLGL